MFQCFVSLYLECFSNFSQFSSLFSSAVWLKMTVVNMIPDPVCAASLVADWIKLDTGYVSELDQHAHHWILTIANKTDNHKRTSMVHIPVQLKCISIMYRRYKPVHQSLALKLEITCRRSEEASTKTVSSGFTSGAKSTCVLQRSTYCYGK